MDSRHIDYMEHSGHTDHKEHSEHKEQSGHSTDHTTHKEYSGHTDQGTRISPHIRNTCSGHTYHKELPLTQRTHETEGGDTADTQITRNSTRKQISPIQGTQ